jgi:hypothetical protein
MDTIRRCFQIATLKHSWSRVKIRIGSEDLHPQPDDDRRAGDGKVSTNLAREPGSVTVLRKSTNMTHASQNVHSLVQTNHWLVTSNAHRDVLPCTGSRLRRFQR